MGMGRHEAKGGAMDGAHGPGTAVQDAHGNCKQHIHPPEVDYDWILLQLSGSRSRQVGKPQRPTTAAAPPESSDLMGLKEDPWVGQLSTPMPCQ